MTLARKDHGPCDRCGKPIEVGQQYHRGLRVIEKGDNLVQAFHQYGQMVIPVKRHDQCFRIPNHPNLPRGFNRRMICRCRRCAFWRWQKNQLQRVESQWPPNASVALRRNREVLDALADL